LNGFSQNNDKVDAIKHLKLVFGMITRPNSQNVAEAFKMVQMTNQNFKRILKANDYFAKFLVDIGFHCCHKGNCPDGTESKYKFSKEVSSPVLAPVVEAPATAVVADENKQVEAEVPSKPEEQEAPRVVPLGNLKTL